MAPGNYLTVGEAAEVARCQPATILAWIRSRALHAVRTPGGRYLIDRADLLLAMEPVRIPDGEAAR